MVKSIVCKSAKERLLATAFVDHSPQSPFDFSERGVARRLARVKNNIPLRPEFGAMHSESFAQPSLDSIADDRTANRTRHGEPQASGFLDSTRARQVKRSE